MASQSETATSATQARYRINEPNSKTRSTLVLALDGSSLSKLANVVGHGWGNARFRGVGALTDGRTPGTPEQIAKRVGLISLEGAETDLLDELRDTDVVIMVAQSGGGAEAAEAVGRACFAKHIMTAGFVFETAGDRDALELTLSQMRPFVISLVVGFDDESLVDVLTALRA
jgi:hypothetical protein